MLEIEIKAKIESIDSLRKKLLRQEFTPLYAIREADTYYNGVNRNFAQTDEALRVRQTELAGDGERRAFVTYKGPKLDAGSKVRKELEVTVSDGSVMGELLRSLGHEAVLEVVKAREYFQKGKMIACLDEVVGLGSYMELEIVTEEGGGYTLERDMLLETLDSLDVSREACTRKSYLELLLEKKKNG